MKFKDYIEEAFKDDPKETQKAKSVQELIASINDGVFSKDGSDIETDRVRINHLNLSSLKGCPKSVNDEFNCSGNNISSLEGGPHTVSGTYYCFSNDLTSLEGIAKGIELLEASTNKLTSLHNIHKLIPSLIGSGKVVNKINQGRISLIGNPIKSHVLGLLMIKGLMHIELSDHRVEGSSEVSDIINKYLEGSRDILDCQEELIEYGYEEFAQL